MRTVARRCAAASDDASDAIATREARPSARRTAAQRRQSAASGPVPRKDATGTARPTEPILLPKVRICFAEFPSPLDTIRPEAAHLGDLIRFWVRSRDSRRRPRASSVARSNFHGTTVGHRRPPQPRPYSPPRACFYARRDSRERPVRLNAGGDPAPDRRWSSSNGYASPSTAAAPLARPRGEGLATRLPRVARCRNVRRLPFRSACRSTLFRTLVLRSGTTHPTPIDVTSETFSTSALRVPTEVEATATAICTRHGSTSPRGDASTLVPPPSYSPTRSSTASGTLHADGRVSVGRCNAILCRGPAIRSVSCYTLHGRCRLP